MTPQSLIDEFVDDSARLRSNFLRRVAQIQADPRLSTVQRDIIQEILGRLILNMTLERRWTDLVNDLDQDLVQDLTTPMGPSSTDRETSPRLVTRSSDRTVMQNRVSSHQDDSSRAATYVSEDDLSDDDYPYTGAARQSQPAPWGETTESPPLTAGEIDELMHPTQIPAAESEPTLRVMHAGEIDFRACRDAAEARLRIPFPAISRFARPNVESFKRWLSINTFGGKVMLIERVSAVTHLVYFERLQAAQACRTFLIQESGEVTAISVAQDCRLKRLTTFCTIPSEYTRTLLIDSEDDPWHPIGSWRTFGRQIKGRFPGANFLIVPLWNRSRRLDYYGSQPWGRQRIRGQRHRTLAIFSSIAEAVQVRLAIYSTDPGREISWPRATGFTCEHGLDISDVDLVALNHAGLGPATIDVGLLTADYGEMLDTLSQRYLAQERGEFSIT